MTNLNREHSGFCREVGRLTVSASAMTIACTVLAGVASAEEPLILDAVFGRGNILLESPVDLPPDELLPWSHSSLCREGSLLDGGGWIIVADGNPARTEIDTDTPTKFEPEDGGRPLASARLLLSVGSVEPTNDPERFTATCVSFETFHVVRGQC